jgi:tRNA-(ms[2]io[6]A)-hydroxylase
MLRLKLPTDPRWVNIVESNISEILTDHAWCEQKAASNAVSLVVSYSEIPELVDAMLELAREELQHFAMVHEKIKERGFTLGRERRDEYVNELLKFVRKGLGREIALLDRLLFSAMIEARSCERFRLLSEKINDKDLADFYYELMISEANHYTLFLQLARTYVPNLNVDKRWEEFLIYEGEIIKKFGVKETIHG